jgi:hypothetical protein
VRRKIGRDNVVAEIEKAHNLGVPWRAYQFYLYSGKESIAAIYFGRVRVVGRAAVGSTTSIDGIDRFYFVSIRWMLPASSRTKE